MSTIPATQTYLDASATPTVAAPAALLAGIATATATASQLGQQAAILRAALQQAQILEEDEALRAQFEPLLQTFGAMERQYTELSRHLTEAVTAVRQWQRLDAELRTAATALGYTA